MVAEFIEKKLRDRADREHDPFVSAYLHAMVDRTRSFAANSVAEAAVQAELGPQLRSAVG